MEALLSDPPLLVVHVGIRGRDCFHVELNVIFVLLVGNRLTCGTEGLHFNSFM